VPTIDHLLAEFAVRQLHVKYADAVWRKDLVAFGNCFTEDCEWRIGGMIVRGRDEMVRTFDGIAANFNRILLTFRTPIVESSGGSASARTYVNEMTARKDGGPGTALGLYFDRVVDQGDQWRFKWRLWQTLYRGNADLSGTFFDNVDFGAPPAMPPLDAPPANYPGFPGQSINAAPQG
jgi:ketosteroid isomerase-like protein